MFLSDLDLRIIASEVIQLDTPFLLMSLKKLTPTKPDKDQPWKVWAFVVGLNFVAWVGWYFMHDAPSKW